MSSTIATELTELLNIRYPIMVAGMGGITGAELASGQVYALFVQSNHYLPS